MHSWFHPHYCYLCSRCKIFFTDKITRVNFYLWLDTHSKYQNLKPVPQRKILSQIDLQLPTLQINNKGTAAVRQQLISTWESLRSQTSHRGGYRCSYGKICCKHYHSKPQQTSRHANTQQSSQSSHKQVRRKGERKGGKKIEKGKKQVRSCSNFSQEPRIKHRSSKFHTKAFSIFH